MKELTIHIFEEEMDSFFYSLKRGNLLLYRKQTNDINQILSIIGSEPDISVKVIWDTQSLLIPANIFDPSQSVTYLSAIKSVVYNPLFIQHNECIVLWDSDERMELLSDNIPEDIRTRICHSHCRAEHIKETQTGTLRFTLIRNKLYISEIDENGKLTNSFVSSVYRPEDILYYMSLLYKEENTFLEAPEAYTNFIKRYYNVK